jgi:hypothetical protein
MSALPRSDRKRERFAASGIRYADRCPASRFEMVNILIIKTVGGLGEPSPS